MKTPLVLIAAMTAFSIADNPYPITKKGDLVDDYHGTKIADPFRWLEDDRAADTKAWVEAQNAVTQRFLGQIPFREAIRKRYETLFNYEKFSAPTHEGQYLYYGRNSGLQAQFVLYRQGKKVELELLKDEPTWKFTSMNVPVLDSDRI